MKKLTLALLSGLMLCANIAQADEATEETKAEPAKTPQFLNGSESITKPAKNDAEFYIIIDLVRLGNRYDYELPSDENDKRKELYEKAMFNKSLKSVPAIRKSGSVEVIFAYTIAIDADLFKEQIKRLKIQVPTYMPNRALTKITRNGMSEKKDFIFICQNDGSILHSGTEELLQFWKACTIEPMEEEALANKLEKAKKVALRKAERAEIKMKKKHGTGSNLFSNCPG